MQSVSDALAYFAGTSAKRLALDPAPPGAMWQDTDNGQKLWSTGPDGKWRLHEGIATLASGSFGTNGPVWSRDVSSVLPTVLAVNETLAIAYAPHNTVVSAWLVVNQITRGPATTTVKLRAFATGASAQIGTISWRVVKGVV